MSLVVAIASWLALGAPTAWVMRRVSGPEVAVAVVPFAGALALLLPLVAIAAMGGSLERWGMGAFVSAIGWALAARALLSGASPASDRPWPAPGSLLLAGAVLLASAAILCMTGAILAHGWPGYGWDGLAIWLVRAKVLATAAAFPTSLFGETQLAEGHWDYPLQLPALVAWCARIAGLEVREYAAALGALLAVLPLALAAGLLRVVGAPLAAALALAPFAVPSLVSVHFEGYADPLLVLLVVAAWTFSAGGVVRRDPGLVVVGGLALAMAVGTKNEGSLWWAAILSGIALLSFATGRSSRETGATLLRLGLPGLFLFAAWRLVCAQLGARSDLAGALRFDLIGERLGVVLGTITSVLTLPSGLPALAGCLAAIALLVGGAPASRAWRSVSLLGAAGVYLVGLTLVYLATPYDVGWHLSTSLPRTVFAIAPLLLASAVLAPAVREACEAGADRDTN